MPGSLFDKLDAEKKVGALGSLNADYSFSVTSFPEPGSTIAAEGFALRPGGKSSNQIVQAALLGMDCEMFGQVGEDDLMPLMDSFIFDVVHQHTYAL
ncbi:MAG: hypothetical protein IIY17_02110 [Aeriscardovia sp.]|nr:hypothetical protein [Aeriscardovia sp.]